MNPFLDNIDRSALNLSKFHLNYIVAVIRAHRFLGISSRTEKPLNGLLYHCSASGNLRRILGHPEFNYNACLSKCNMRKISNIHNTLGLIERYQPAFIII